VGTCGRPTPLRLQGGDLFGAAMSLGAIADIDVNEGRLDEAAEGYALGLPLMRSAGTARGLTAFLHSMAELDLMRGDPQRADLLAREAWDAAVRTRDAWHLGLLTSVRAAAARDRGASEQEQLEATRTALRTASAQSDPQVLLEVVEHVAGCLVDRGDMDDALRLLRASSRYREQQGVAWSVPRRARRDADEARALRTSSAPDLGITVDLAWLAAAAGDALA